MQDLNGKRLAITGGSQGLGLAMVEALAACGEYGRNWPRIVAVLSETR